MALELENSYVKISREMQEEAAQNIIEADIIVPDVKPDVVNVLQCDGDVKVTSREVHKDTVVLRGVVNFNILYMSDDPSRPICSMKHSANFDQTFDLPGIDSSMKCYVNNKIEHIDANILNGRKLNVKAILNNGVRVVEPAEVAAISGISGIENAQVLVQSYDTYNNVDYGEAEGIARYEAEVLIDKPAIKEILKTTAAIKEKDVKVAGGKVVVKGSMEVSSLYVPDIDEKPIEFIVSDVPFSEVLDFADIADSADIDLVVNVKDVAAEVKEDDDGDSRLVDYEILLGFEASSLEKQTFQAISDAYGISEKLELEKSPVKVSSVVGDTKTQSTIKDVVKLSADEPAVERMFNVSCNPVISDVRVENDKVHVEGVIDTNITYLSNNPDVPLGSQKHAVPFHHILDIKGVRPTMRPQVRIEMDNCIFDVSDEREIELKFVITVHARVLNEEFNDVVTKIEEVPLDDRRLMAQPSMTVYYVQNGDTLWNIAKKYLTTMNDLLKVNSLEAGDSLVVGQQLLIPKAS